MLLIKVDQNIGKVLTLAFYCLNDLPLLEKLLSFQSNLHSHIRCDTCEKRAKGISCHFNNSLLRIDFLSFYEKPSDTEKLFSSIDLALA